MADIVIDAAAKADTSRVVRGLVFTSALVGYFFFIDADDDFKYSKTTDGGATWGAPVIVCGGTVLSADVWFDQWTSGDTGTIIHTWAIESGVDDVLYRTLDTASDTLGTQRTLFAGASASASTATIVTGTKARGGNLYCAYDIDNGIETGFSRSNDGGVTWTARTTHIATPWAAGQYYQAFPGNESDPQDIWLLYHFTNTGHLILRTHDDSANSWASSSNIVAVVDNITDLTGQYLMSGAIRHSDGHLIVAAWTEYDSATGDFRVFDVTNGSSWVELTAIATDKDDSYYPAVFIDQFTDDLYVAYIGKKDGSETLGTTNSVCYVSSTDGGTTWGAEVVYSATASDWRRTWAPQSGRRFMVAWRDISSQELATNFDNSLTFTPPAGVSFAGELQWGPLTLQVFWAPIAFTGEGAFTADLTVLDWRVSYVGEGAFTADLTGHDWRVSYVGEGELAGLDLILFPGWAVSYAGEGGLTAADLTIQAFAVSFVGEGAFTAALTTSFSVSFVGEGAFSANLGLAITFTVSFAGEGRLSTLNLTTHPIAKPRAGVLLQSVSLTEALNGPATLQFEAQEFDLQVGHEVDLAIDAEGLFKGPVLGRRKFIVGNKYDRTACNAIDRGWILTRSRFSGRYSHVSATNIVLDIMAGVTGFDLTHVQSGMPTIEDLRFSNATRADALTQVMQSIEGHWRIAYPNLFIAAVVENFGEDPEPLTTHHPTLRFDLDVSDDLSRVVNRVTVRGAGATVIAPPPLEFPNYWPVAFDEATGLDRTRFYPGWSEFLPGQGAGAATRLFLNTVKTEEPDEVDEDGEPFNPAKKVPPRQIFNPSGGTVLIDDTHELPYARAGEMTGELTWGWSRSDALTAVSRPGGDLPTTDDGVFYYFYVATLVTEWGETPMRAYSGTVALGSTLVDDESVVDRSFLVRVLGVENPRVRGINVYRQSTIGSGWGSWIKVGSTPSGGGVFVDSVPPPADMAPDELPTTDTSAHPPMPFIDLAPHGFPIRVGASVRVIETVNDLDSQATLAAFLTTDDLVDDGVIVGEPLDDQTLTYSQLQEAGQIHLATRSIINTTIKWTCRDRRTHVGRLQAIDLPQFRGEATIQAVSWDTFAPHQYDGTGLKSAPIAHATAAARHVTLNDVLRRRMKG